MTPPAIRLLFVKDLINVHLQQAFIYGQRDLVFLVRNTMRASHTASHLKVMVNDGGLHQSPQLQVSQDFRNSMIDIWICFIRPDGDHTTAHMCEDILDTCLLRLELLMQIDILNANSHLAG